MAEAEENTTGSPDAPRTGRALLNRLRRWWQQPPPPDPWSEELNAAVMKIDAVPVCHHCLEPQPPVGWFCPRCGTAVGPYNNLLPYVCIFSNLEVLLSGLSPNAQFKLLFECA